MKYFKSKNFKNIKVIIFDFDETMYYSKNIRKYYIDFIKKAVMTLGGHSEQEAMSLMEKIGFTLENKNSPSFSGSLAYFGITRQQWDEYRTESYFEIDYENAQTVDNSYYAKLAKKYRLFIVSNELYKNLVAKSGKMNIDLTHFEKIYAPQVSELNSFPKKIELYKIIKEATNVNFDQMLVIGDRLQVDIMPIVELGGNGLFVSTPSDIMQFCDKELF